VNSPVISTKDAEPVTILPDMLALSDAATQLAQSAFEAAKNALAPMVVVEGRPKASLIEQHQYLAHGLSWIATYTEVFRQMNDWAQRLDAEGKFGDTEALILQIGCGEYLNQLLGGIPMSQNEMIRLSDFGIDWHALKGAGSPRRAWP
jgi:(2S)-methylsuccinyl-CoA dehydrogenase